MKITSLAPIGPNLPSLQAPQVVQTESAPHAHSLKQGDTFIQTHGPDDPFLPWSFATPHPLSTSLIEAAKNAKPEVIQALVQNMPLMGAKNLWQQDERAPHLIIRSAFAMALKNHRIDVTEALELRSLLLQIPASERQRYRGLIESVAMDKAAEPILKDIDLDLAPYQKDFTAREIALIDSPSFKLVFPNFTALSMAHQRQVITELNVFLKHFPDLLSRLNAISNDHYGQGFQYFFVTNETNKAFDSVVPKNMAGVVMPGANVVKDPLLGLVAKKISLRILDRGGMYMRSIDWGTFSHEFAHVIHLNMLNDDQRDKVKNLYDQAWQIHKQNDGKKGFVTNYAQTNPYEYFAEGVEYYLTGGQTILKTKDPALYTLMQQIFAPGKIHSGKDGHLFNDPERVHIVASRQGGKTLGGISLSRESDLVSIKHFEGGITSEVMVLGGEKTALARGSVGLKATWKPWTKPAGIYATAGAVAQAGVLDGKVSIGAGGFVGAGVDYKYFNAEVRQNFMAGKNTPNATEFRAGLRFEF